MRASILLLLVALCSCAAEGEGGPDSGSDMAATASDMGSGVYDLGACAVVQVTPLNAFAPTTLTAVANAASGGAPSWTVETPSGIETPTSLGSGLVATYEADEPGSYVFTVSYPGGTPCPGSGSVLVRAPQSQAQAYRVRLTPPGSSFLPQQDTFITVYGNTPNLDQVLFVQTGTPVSSILRSAAGPIAGQVLLVPASGPETRVAVPPSGSFSLFVRLDASYRVILFPDDPALAPRSIGPLDGSLLAAASYQVDAGQGVSGVVRDELGAVLPGARLALRAGPLPSGLGQSAADGSFSLRAEPGTYQLAVAAAGWPDLTLDGVTVGGDLALTVDHALTRSPVSLRVVASDGTTPVAGANVSLRSVSLPGAAQVGLPSGPQSASGAVRLSRTSLADGTLGPLLLPAATYDVLIEPPDAHPEGRTGLRLYLSGGSVDLILSQSLSFTGQVRTASGEPVPGARARIFTATGFPDGRQAMSDSAGAFSLALDSGIPVDLMVDPPASMPLASRRVHLGSTDGSLGGALPLSQTITLEAGLPVAGRVLGPSGNPLGGVAIDVLCASCNNPVAIAHAESETDGAYRLALPDPGPLFVDAGTD